MKKFIVLLLSILMVLSMVACGTQNPTTPNDSNASKPIDTAQNGEDDAGKEPATRIVVDMLGREVEIPTKINSIICTGSNALRMVSYIQSTDLLIGVEETDKGYETSTKRDYAHAYYNEFKDLPAIGKGGGTAYTAYPEEVLKVNPDIILTCFVQEAAEQLQNETGIPVVRAASV